MKSKEMIDNDKTNTGLNKQQSTSQEKQIPNELIQDNNYHTNLTIKDMKKQNNHKQQIFLKQSENRRTKSLKIKPRN